VSIAAVQWVYSAAPAHGAAQRAVALSLAWRHTPEDGAFPSRETLAADTQLKDRAIGNALRALEAAGVIRRDGYRPGGGTVVWRFPALDGPARDAEPAGPARRAVPHAGPAPDAESVRHHVPPIGPEIAVGDRNGQGSGDHEGPALRRNGRTDVAREPDREPIDSLF
jgi:hypothetical protein